MRPLVTMSQNFISLILSAAASGHWSGLKNDKLVDKLQSELLV